MLKSSYSFGEFNLTLAEVRAISLLMVDITHKEIAAILGILPSSLENRMQKIYSKLRIHKDRIVVLWAIENGFDRKGNLNGDFLFEGYDKLPADFTE